MSAEAIDGTLSVKTYDQIPLGVVRVGSDRKISYANQALRKLIGADPVGSDLFAFIDEKDEESRTRLEAEFRKRMQDRAASQYEIVITRPADGVRVPVSVSAAPEFDAAGNAVGSLALVRDLSVDKVNCAIHAAIERETTMAGLLDAFRIEVAKLIPFDSFRVTLVSENRKHLMGLYEHPDEILKELGLKWWPMPPIVLEFLKRTDVHDLDVPEWFSHPEAQELARTDPGTKQWLEKGYQHILVRPVLREGAVAAFVAMETRNAQPYGEEQLRLCEQLPVSEVVLGALQLEKQRELRFALDLIAKMGDVSEDIGAVARVLVERLHTHYRWEHVSVFQVDKEARRLRMIAQAGADGMRIKEGYSQPLDTGLLGRAYRGGKGSAVNVGDVRDPDQASGYVVGIEATRAEMCLPIPGKKLRWILNVESNQKNAFADEEQAAVELLLQEAGFILERAALLGLKLAVMNSIKDAVIQTNDKGRILEVNHAAAELFGAGSGTLVRRNLAELIADAEGAEAVASDSGWPRTEVNLKRVDGSVFPALLSCARLPSELGGKVFVATDLSYQKRVEESERLKDVFWQVAQETRTPLALVASWLRRANESSREELCELLDKSVRQLRKMDVTLERVMRIASAMHLDQPERTALDLRALVRDVLDELPKGDAARIDWRAEEALPRVLASHEDLEFCVSNLVGVMVRSGAQQEKLVVAARRRPDAIVLEMRNVADAPQRAPVSSTSTVKQTDLLLSEMKSGVEVVKTTLARMGADLESGSQARDGFAIRLPMAQ